GRGRLGRRRRTTRSGRPHQSRLHGRRRVTGIPGRKSAAGRRRSRRSMSPSGARRRVLAANWKMNLGPTDARAFMAAFLASYSPKSDRTVLIFPPALSLTSVRDALGGRRDVQLGVQNIHTEPKGAFTGESSAAMAKDAGAHYALVGHSERRHVFGETDEATARKVALAVQTGLTPMLCIGE